MGTDAWNNVRQYLADDFKVEGEFNKMINTASQDV